MSRDLGIQPTDLPGPLWQHVLLNLICFGAGTLTGARVNPAALPRWMIWTAGTLLGLAAVALALTVVSAWRAIRAVERRYREEDRRRRESE
jgi:hypothetical protein